MLKYIHTQCKSKTYKSSKWARKTEQDNLLTISSRLAKPNLIPVITPSIIAEHELSSSFSFIIYLKNQQKKKSKTQIQEFKNSEKGNNPR